MDASLAYQDHLKAMLRLHPHDRDLAFAEGVGSKTVELFRSQGDGHVAVLRHHGLTDGMAVYDLGCGCGRTAQALVRSGWQGRYIGADIVPGFIDELRRKCPGYVAHVHKAPTLCADDATLDIVYHWSVFTHLPPEECFLYLEDSWRALKPGGRTVFSFLEIGEPLHQDAFMARVRLLRAGKPTGLLDTFLHRDWICHWARQLGFSEPSFTNGADESHHPAFWQTLVAMQKPAA
ncbi:class I SAM-dependent methyltransferase [Novosphingobium sp. FKTRR1]|uniref:class I SAM-dependent methyltransferase n=1 Tax=Novosphingobium sp. FKTRR1 TaxID=2879118 RepID=UPI001CF04627|nr:class I SAM-dependent methyltransferase [Novosphingobium sp. FKTRR1]